MTIEELLSRLHGVRKSESGKVWSARCPAHDDAHNSLSVTSGDDGRVLFYCHARCERAEVLRVLSLTDRDLFPADGETRRNGHRGPAERSIVATYPYHNEAGALLFETVRYEPKDFRQRRPDSQGAWIWNLDGVRRVLYRLPELRDERTVYVTEGEKDADRLASLGFAATTAPMGAGKWREEYVEQLTAVGCEQVVVIEDHDEAGHKHALDIVAACRRANLAVTHVSLPWPFPRRAKHGEDVSDWLVDHTEAELRNVIAATGSAVGERGTAEVNPSAMSAGAPRPALRAEAFYGLAGRVVESIEPTSEADPAALLVHVLLGVGNLVGRNVYARVERTIHPCNEFAVLVGQSAKGRKGQAWSTPRALLELVSPEWVKGRVRTGLSSGEGLIYHVRDKREELQPVKKGGKVVEYDRVIVDAGEDDKRLFVFESELAGVLRRMNGETSSLSAVMRQAWDSGDLSTLTRNNPLRATGAHVSVIAHVTREELIANLTETERANGFANRFLFCLVKRSKMLPEGGSVSDGVLLPLAEELRQVVAFAADPRELQRSPAAREMWAAVYPTLSEGEPGLLGAILGRADPHVLRLSLLYAVLDCAPAVEPEHLEAALALWDYAEASARAIFGGRSGIADEDVLVDAVRSRGRLSQTQISALFHRNKTTAQLEALLTLAEQGGKIRRTTVSPEGGRGRPVTVWEAV